MKISEIITDKYKLRIPPTVYYDLLADVAEAEENQEPNREFEDYENEIEGLQNRLDIAEYEKERLREEVTNLEAKIKALEQEPKTGHWIADVDKWGDVVTTINGYKCSECGEFNADKDNYCPNCGADMRGNTE